MTPGVSPGTFDWVRRGVWAVLALAVLALLVRGADGPPDPYLAPAGAGAADAAEVEQPAASELSSAAPSLPDDAPGPPGPPTTTVASPDGASPVPTTTSSGAEAGAGRSAPSDGAAPPAPPSPTAVAQPPTPARRPLPGFGEVDYRITAADGRTFAGAALLAADGPSRSQGLMEQTDLRGYDAMVFRFPSPTRGEFYMRNTRIPLSIAFFDADGRFVSSADMEPCPDEVRRCPTYGAARPYVHAIEVAAGDLGRMGIGPGAVLSFP